MNWTPVTDKSSLPPFNIPVLVTDRKQMSVAKLIEYSSGLTPKGWEITCVCGYEWDFGYITHWMPTPSLPGANS